MAEPVEIDDNLYSRQRYVLGDEAMKKMVKSSVFLSGLGGLGVEIAKNIALAGVRLLHLNDHENATFLDLGTQFYLAASDVGKNRVAVTTPKIAELNPYVKVSSSEVDLAKSDLAILDTFKLVILTDAPLSLQLRVNEYCHAKGIQFMSAEVRGVFSSAFVDFCEHEVVDPNGEDPKSAIIANITQAKPPIVTVLENHRHGLEDNDCVEFKEVKGMTELNGRQFKVKVVNPQSVSLHDLESGEPIDNTGFGVYIVGGGGVMTEVKRPQKIKFLPLAAALQKPAFVTTDWVKFDSPQQLLIGFQALHAFAEKNKSLPLPWHADHAKQVIELAEELNARVKQADKLDHVLLRQLAFVARGSIVGLTGFMGGVLAQEALKALTGKYLPIQQFLFFDAVEILPSVEDGKFDPSDFVPRNDRSDAHRIVVGQQTCAKLESMRLFMIGAGAIGCEMLKNFAMLHVATSDGKITVTDNDLIEMSNLNRQFLFRKKDIRTPKSTTAAAAAKAMNPAVRITAEQDKVGTETERKYDDEFYEDLDVVVNALDNVAARLYVDSRCVANQRPLLESGTLGTKGHVQVILPFLTESYGSRRDPPEADVPFCTLKSFPSAMEHCIEWARDFSFEAQFVNRAQTANQMFDEPNLADKLSTLSMDKLRELRIIAKMIRSRPTSFVDCIKWARRKFETYYSNSIRQLLHNFPLDAKLKDGTPFWAAPKRPPTPLKYNPDDAAHAVFVASAAALYAKMWRISVPHSREDLLNKSALVNEVLSTVKLPEWQPKASKKIETDEKVKRAEAEKEATNETAEEEFKKLLAEVRAFVVSGGKLSLEPADFEKDDDSNFHIDFITACANLRARVYLIAEYERLKVKRIAGRIIPAIATTTAAVSGLVTLELVKIAQQRPLAAYKNAFINLGISLFAFSEPAEVTKTKITDAVSYSMWDRWKIDEGDVTLGEFIKFIEDRHKLNVAGVFHEVTMIYSPMFPAHAKRLPQKMTALLTKVPAGAKHVDLIVHFSRDNDDQLIQGPSVRLMLPRKKKVLKKNHGKEGDEKSDD